MNNILVIFILLHICGDFYFQNQSMAERKNSSYLFVVYHSIFYFITMFFLFIFYKVTLSLLISMSIVGLSHFIIDSIKFLFMNRYNKESNSLFIVDQLLHFLVLFSLFLVIKNSDLVECYERFSIENIILYLNCFTALLVIFKPANILIKSILPSSIKKGKEEEISSVKFGKLIGNLERLLILMLLCVNQYVVIGYIFTAKSIARWKKLVEDKDFAEYYLVGTLLSVIIAIVVYFIFCRNIFIK